jgi:8-oxo-dGTP diphosphatase
VSAGSTEVGRELARRWEVSTDEIGEPLGSGDGWVICAAGHRHWGRHGAAGVFITDGTRVVLQHRAVWTHQGDTWGVPGGARDNGESALNAAMREANEEAGLLPRQIRPVGLYLVDHGGWSYTTVVARPIGQWEPRTANAESVSVEWVDLVDVPSLPLHAGLAGAWPDLLDPPAQLHILVPDLLRGHPVLAQIAQQGVRSSALPSSMDAGRLQAMLPAVHLFGDLTQAAAAAARYAEGGQVLIVDDAGALEWLGETAEGR